ncbi:restriction endonuclease subunit S [Escherichia coli]|uniref:restriction endonuclease subunit S n=1 Tax=Escherichia coli TaxID=562 RepID=UPI000DF48BC1|nr:restriction endonuclease subunit S [Escherichia coli]EGK4005140.1 restriction endonuclease subunit S [Escherichia coli]RDA00163.1 restriction endonuclease subunit S [Escherichia coli]
MSELSYLEKLLDGAEVEWLPLSSLCNLITTGKLNANAMEDNGAYPFFTCNEEPYRINTYAFDLEAILISGNGSQVGHLNYYNGKFNAYQRTYILGGFNENVDIMYLYYYLMHTLKPYIHKNSRKGSVPYITMPMLENFKFPIPCPNNLEKSLAIQSEIVRILDKFTALTAELTAELNMRKKQYNYYRDQLLSFDEEQEKPIYLEKLLDGVEVEWKTLEDISIKISSGGTPKTGVSEFYDGDIPWLRTQEVNFCDIWDTEVKITESGVKNSSAKWIPKNCVIVAMYGATVGKIGINKIPMTTNQACANIQLNEEVAHYRYVFHFLCSQYTYIKSLGTGSQTNINAQIVKNIKIPIPCPDNPKKSLAIQSEIVRILDKFDTLTNSITEGLPREIELRQKQYEYYRDLLFSFPKPETVSN